MRTSPFILSVFCLIALMLPVTALASYSGGEGTAENPYLLASTADWLLLCQTGADWGKYFTVTDDLDFNGVSMTPLGSYEHPFTGTLDGKGHSFDNIRLDLANDLALFSRINNATILNLHLKKY